VRGPYIWNFSEWMLAPDTKSSQKRSGSSRRFSLQVSLVYPGTEPPTYVYFLSDAYLLCQTGRLAWRAKWQQQKVGSGPRNVKIDLHGFRATSRWNVTPTVVARHQLLLSHALVCANASRLCASGRPLSFDATDPPKCTVHAGNEDKGGDVNSTAKGSRPHRPS